MSNVIWFFSKTVFFNPEQLRLVFTVARRLIALLDVLLRAITLTYLAALKRS